MKHYTGIGSRETPKDILELMQKVGYVLAEQNFILRSGAAQGADKAFEKGAKEWDSDTSDGFNCPTIAEIYLPWKSFSSYEDYYKNWYWDLDKIGYKKEVYQLASEVHPAWSKCSDAAKALHARNTFQVLGPTLDKPSKFLICWAKLDRGGNIKGGTATAWNIAKMYDVPRFNLYNEEDKQRLINFVGEK